MGDVDKLYLEMAAVAAKRSKCLRRQYGAVIVRFEEGERVVSVGFNAAPDKMTSCTAIGECWKEANGIPHGEQYENCRSVHAEQNAIIGAAPSEMKGATLYLAGFENGKELDDPKPCTICMRMIMNASIDYVVTRKGVMKV